MKCSPFSRGLRKGGKHMHHHRGRFMEHLRHGFMDNYESSSSSAEDCPKNQQAESGNDLQNRMEHGHGMKHMMGHGHGMRHGHCIMHRMRHGHGHDMMDRMRYGHGHDMMHRMKHGHDMMHGMRHGHDMMKGMKHGHSMKHWHGMKHGKEHDLTMEHRIKHHHGMKHNMRHSHGRKHKMGHGPGMHHKLRHGLDKSCRGNQNEESSLEVDIENVNDSSENESFTFYRPKTNAQVMSESNKFQISLETSYYQPEEVSIKIVDGKIDVSAMHESMEDDVYEFHEMYRSFNIPNNVNPEVITAHLDINGKLTIEAVCNQQEENLPSTERDIPVIRVTQ